MLYLLSLAESGKRPQKGYLKQTKKPLLCKFHNSHQLTHVQMCFYFFTETFFFKKTFHLSEKLLMNKQGVAFLPKKTAFVFIETIFLKNVNIRRETKTK